MPGSLGGGQQGGAVVQSTAPWAAMQAGQIGAQAAAAASQAATTQMNAAINSLNMSFSNAAKSVRPYTQEGVQALNQLNQYLQLNPYDPGAKPVAPTVQSIADRLGIGHAQAVQYVQQNSSRSFGPGNTPGWIAAGGGKEDTGSGPQNMGQSVIDPITGNTYYMGALPGQSDFGPGGAQQFSASRLLGSGATYDNPDAGNTTKLEQDIIKSMVNPAYNSAMDQYNQQLPDWEYAKASQDAYTAQGPLTAQQIQDRISNQPGFQAELAQGIDAIDKSSAAKGYLGSGRLLKELTNFGQNQLSTYYGNTLTQLANLAGSGQQAATQQANLYGQQGGALASLYQSLGDTQGNALLAAGKAKSDALINANQQFQTIGGSDGGGFGSLLGGIASVAGIATSPASTVAGVTTGGSTLGSSIANWISSSRHLKTMVMTPSTEEILENVKKLSLDKWKYKGTDAEHIGPYAEEFKELFHVGDGQTISAIDMFGVLIGAVKELSIKLDELSMKDKLDKIDRGAA